MAKRTIVGWNATPGADAAVAWAIEREAGRAGTVTIIDVVDSALYLGDVESVDPTFEADEQRRLDALVDRLNFASPEVGIESTLVVGDPLDALFAETSPNALVVVGTERRIGPRARFGWSFGARLAAAADGPVAIVPETGPEDASRSGIVVGIDGTRVGDRALEFAAREASRRGEPLTIVHAWLEPLAWQPTAVPDEDFVKTTESVRRELLDDRVRTLSERHLELTVTSVLVHGEPVVALCEAAKTATALVVGSRRLGNWKRAWLGSVSHGVILELASPVIVVGPDEEHQG